MQPNFILDDEQQALLELFNKYSKYFQTTRLNKILGFFKAPKLSLGIYIYGNVGRGKTMLTRAFFEELSISKSFIHFQSFMKNIHEKLYILRSQKSPAENLFRIIADEYSKHTKIIFLDEFEIKDIADAMTLARLIPEFHKQNIFTVLTTNIPPKELYKDGIQRESFLPFIDYIMNNFEIISLTKGQDYRLTKDISLSERILFPLSPSNKKRFEDYVNKLTKQEFTKKTIEVYGRKIIFSQVCRKILVTNFIEMFEEERSHADYIEICQNFDLIIIDYVPIIDPVNRNVNLRFINFLDQIYITKTLLITIFQDKPETILNTKNGLKETKRALSRIYELNSEEYFKQSKYYINEYGKHNSQ